MSPLAQPRATQTAAPRWTGRRRALVSAATVVMTGLVACMGNGVAAAATPTTTPDTTVTSTTGATTTTPTTVASGSTTTSTVAPTGATVTPRAGAIAARPHGAVTLNGVGSSFAAPAIETWTRDVSNSPYSLNLNYSSTNSGDGRYQFVLE